MELASLHSGYSCRSFGELGGILSALGPSEALQDVLKYLRFAADRLPFPAAKIECQLYAAEIDHNNPNSLQSVSFEGIKREIESLQGDKVTQASLWVMLLRDMAKAGITPTQSDFAHAHLIIAGLNETHARFNALLELARSEIGAANTREVNLTLGRRNKKSQSKLNIKPDLNNIET
jgi:hypothetical protein